jgi:hypothetical protein
MVIEEHKKIKAYEGLNGVHPLALEAVIRS